MGQGCRGLLFCQEGVRGEQIVSHAVGVPQVTLVHRRVKVFPCNSCLEGIAVVSEGRVWASLMLVPLCEYINVYKHKFQN